MESEKDVGGTQPTRKRLPDDRPSLTHAFTVDDTKVYLTIGLYPESRMPGEIFVVIDRASPSITGIMDAFAKSISLALQYGVPLEVLCTRFIGTHWRGGGFTSNGELPVAQSVIDYIFKYLKLKYLDETSEVESE